MSYYLCVYIKMHDYLCLQCAKESNNYICLHGAILKIVKKIVIN